MTGNPASAAGPAKTKRKGLSKRTRFNVFKRDGFTCQYCGAHPPKVVLHVDHITPVVEGGGNDIDNLVTSCEEIMGLFHPGQNSVPRDSFMSARRFIELLGFDEVLESAEIALAAPSVNSKFKYFCGVCWSKIRSQEVRA